MRCKGFSLRCLLLLQNTGCSVRASVVPARRLSCGWLALGHVAGSSCNTGAHCLWLSDPQVCKLQQLWHVGLVAPGHVESFRTRHRTCVGRWVLIHCTATREVQPLRLQIPTTHPCRSVQFADLTVECILQTPGVHKL